MNSRAFSLRWFAVWVVFASLFMSADRSRKTVAAEIAQLRSLPDMG